MMNEDIPDSLRSECIDYAEQKADMEKCRLPASGFTETLDRIYDWAKQVVSAAKAELHGADIRTLVWAYREQNCEWLSVGIYDENNFNYIITFLIGEPHNFDINCPSVPDMTEALHMTGIVLDALGLVATIGRRGNEVNKYCTPETWKPAQTSATLVLA